MEYYYSYLIDPSSYDNQGLCNGIPLRVHRNSDIDEAGTIRLRKDWRKYVGPLPLTSYGGNMGPLYSFTSVAIPECLPDRLELVSYVMEFGFLHDDLVDVAKTTEIDIMNNQIMNELDEGLMNGKLSGSKAGEGQLLASLVEQLTNVDAERAKEVMRYWKKDLSIKRDRTEFKDFEDYLEYRIVDCGSFFLIALATFGMGLTIPGDEKEICFEITRPVWAAAALTNDIQSWDKECKLMHMQDKTDMINSVWILMKEKSIDIKEAKCHVSQKVKNFVTEYVDTVKNIKTRQDLSRDSRRFVEAMQFMISGNLLWGTSSPRYHPNWNLSEIQIARLKNSQTDQTNVDNHYGNCATYEKRIINDKTALIANSKDDCNKIAKVILMQDLPDLHETIINGPPQYLASLPSKNIRDKATNALNIWLRTPEDGANRIKKVTDILHNASLLLDDVQDGSEYRRGKPSAHSIFGVAQTINSAGHQVIQAMKETQGLDNVHCINIFREEVQSIYVGQSYDLYWTSNIICPSISDFLRMIDGKTGGLFRLMARLMEIKSTSPVKPDLARLTTLFSRYFQIRDDYMNLSSSEYTEQKGFCEDLDEGKLSLSIIHALKHFYKPESLVLKNLLVQRRSIGKLSMAQKKLILELLQRLGSLDYTVATLQILHTEIMSEIEKIETDCGIKNPLLHSLILALRV